MLLFSARGTSADWYKNLQARPEDARLRIGFKTYHPEVEFIEDSVIVEEMIRWYVKKYPRSSKMIFGWNPNRDDSEETDLTSLVKVIKIVKLSLI